jgi:hypothetical protein
LYVPIDACSTPAAPRRAARRKRSVALRCFVQTALMASRSALRAAARALSRAAASRPAAAWGAADAPAVSARSTAAAAAAAWGSSRGFSSVVNVVRGARLASRPPGSAGVGA